jgi:peptidase C25-like protein/Ig-like domain-containing protein
MNIATTRNWIPRMLLSVCATLFAASVAFVPSAYMQQGGTYTIKRSVIGGGGGTSTNGTIRMDGTIGQGVLGLSSGGTLSLNAGFWQNGPTCVAAGIGSQPASQTVCVGSQISFSVSTNGTVSGYQWRKNGVNLTDVGNVSGAQTGTLVINPATPGDGGSYDCVVSGSCGAPVTSNAAALTVIGYQLSSTGQSYPSSGGSGSVNVTTGASCGWTAVSNAGWVVINSGSSGTGNGTVLYTVGANSGGGRTGTMTIAGQTFTVSQDAPTAVTLVSFNAKAYPDGVLIEWRTGMEVDNLGFNVYRDEGGKRSRVNSQVLAGSGLKVGHGVAIGSGCSYAWWDDRPASQSTAYWLEDIDLNGQSLWHGPFGSVTAVDKQRPPSVEKARSLAALSMSEAPSSVLESRAVQMTRSSPAGQTGSNIASTPGVVKLGVRREGWYRVRAEELIEAGLNRTVDPRKLQMFVDGKEQAVIINGEDDGSFDTEDSIEFYGQGFDSAFSEQHMYYVVPGKERGRRVPAVDSPARPTRSGSFPFTVERRDRTIYFSALRNGEKENFFGAVVGQAVNQSLSVSHLSDSHEPAALEIAMQGVTYGTHTVTIQINGHELGQLGFQGQAQGVSTFQIGPALLSEGLNQLTLVARGGPSDVSLVDYIRLTYQHAFTAEQDRLKFTASGGQAVTIDGFTSKSVRVFDVTDPLAVEEISGDQHKDESGYAVSVIPPGAGQRALLAVANDNVSHVAEIVSDYPSSLRDPAQGADLLIITRRDLFDSARELAALRQKEGMTVGMVDIDDIYDEFSFGEKTPQAVKDFLALARTSWKKPVRYVLMLGDASLDPKNYLGVGDFDLVPTRLVDTTFMETASDDWLTDFNGDGIADIPIGRLPVRSAAEAASMITKIVGYQQSNASEEAVLVSDLNDGIDFELLSEQLIPLIPRQMRVTHLKRAQLGDGATHAALMELIGRGQRIVNYNGHGNVDMWRGVFSAPDAFELTNEKQLAMFVIMNCLNGYFQDPLLDSLAESLLKSSGGAVAVWASSAMTYADGQAPMNAEFYRQVLANSPARLGDAAIRAKAATADVDVRRSWVLLGDPTMRLK